MFGFDFMPGVIVKFQCSKELKWCLDTNTLISIIFTLNSKFLSNVQAL